MLFDLAVCSSTRSVDLAVPDEHDVRARLFTVRVTSHNVYTIDGKSKPLSNSKDACDI